MSYRIQRNETLEGAVRRIAWEQIDGAIAELEDDALDVHETIHEVRKRCKRLRGLLRLVRPALGDAYREENAWFRDTARIVSELRDTTALCECWDALMKRYEKGVDRESFRAIGRALEAHREETFKERNVKDLLATFEDRMKEARRRVEDWHLEGGEVEAVSTGTAKTYRRARKAMQAAYQSPSAESFHEWRKRVKYHRYHNRLLLEIWPSVLGERRNEVKYLSDVLGDAHDLAVLRATLVREVDRFADEAYRDAVVGLAASRRKELQAWAMPLGRKLFADKTKVWRSWLEILLDGLAFGRGAVRRARQAFAGAV